MVCVRGRACMWRRMLWNVGCGDAQRTCETRAVRGSALCGPWISGNGHGRDAVQLCDGLIPCLLCGSVHVSCASRARSAHHCTQYRVWPRRVRSRACVTVDACRERTVRQLAVSTLTPRPVTSCVRLSIVSVRRAEQNDCKRVACALTCCGAVMMCVVAVPLGQPPVDL